MKITVLIPTYRRPDDLRRCLEALSHQDRPADEVRVVVRNTDDVTPAVLAEFAGQLPIAVSSLSVTGVVAAMNVGLRDATGDVIAITDDDAAPWVDWLARIERVFAERPEVVGVGGRDWVYHGDELEDGVAKDIGVIRWFGRHVGDHHLATAGGARAVDVLKGVNCAYRAPVLREIGFDTRLRGTGAQTHWELSLCLAIRRRGGVLWYDPEIAVHHAVGPRFDEDQRDSFNALAVCNAGHNETLAMLEHLSEGRRVIFGLWALLIGTRLTPGLAQVPRLLLRKDRDAVARFVATLRGRLLACRDPGPSVPATVRLDDRATQPVIG